MKRDWDPRNVEGRYVGHHWKTGAVLILTSDGLKHGTGGMKLPVEQRWTLEGWDTLRGLPWDVRTRQRRTEHTFVDAEAQQEAQPKVITIPGGYQPYPQVKRPFYVTRGIMEKYNTGFTMNCRGCESLQVGGTQATHSDECRKARQFD